MNRSPKQKISKGIVVLSDTIDQFDLIAIQKTLHSKPAEYTFKSIWNILQDRSHATLKNKSQKI